MVQQTFATILDDVRENKPSLTHLRLVYKKLGPIEAGFIAEALSDNTYVTSINLDSNLLGDRGIQILCGALKV